jgi:hypothetical protein
MITSDYERTPVHSTDHKALNVDKNVDIPLAVASECASDAERPFSVSMRSMPLELANAAGQQIVSVTEAKPALYADASEQFSLSGDNAVYSHRPESCQGTALGDR